LSVGASAGALSVIASATVKGAAASVSVELTLIAVVVISVIESIVLYFSPTGPRAVDMTTCNFSSKKVQKVQCAKEGSGPKKIMV
jgi:hypothetical protein